MPVNSCLFCAGRCAEACLSGAGLLGGKLDRFDIPWMVNGGRPAS